jgi:hypothetical protein
MLTFILNWYGPYTSQDLENDKEFGNGVYLITGKQSYERKSVIQYCGITKGTFYNRIKNHHKKEYVKKEMNFWLSNFTYPTEITRKELELAETIIVFFWQPSLNEKKKFSIPNSTTIVNLWFKIDGTPRHNQLKIFRDLSDVISWDGECWRTGNLRVRTA